MTTPEINIFPSLGFPFISPVSCIVALFLILLCQGKEEKVLSCGNITVGTVALHEREREREYTFKVVVAKREA